MDQMKQQWHRYRYKNLTYLLVSFVVALLILKNDTLHTFLQRLGHFGYIGAFVGGLLFSSTFTVSIGAVILMVIAENHSPLEIALIAGLGGATCDLLILRLIKNKGMVEEIKHLFHYLGGDQISQLLHTKYFSWTLPVIGGLIIASPLPDELGVGLMGLTQLKTSYFFFISFIFNFVGMFLVATTGNLLRP